MELANLHKFLLQVHLWSLSLAISSFVLGIIQRHRPKVHAKFMITYSLLGFITVGTATIMAAVSLLFPGFGQNSQSFMALIAKSIGYPQGPLAGYALGLIPGYAFLICILETLKEKKRFTQRRTFLILKKATYFILTILTIVAVTTFDERYLSVYISRIGILIFLVASIFGGTKLKSHQRHIFTGIVSFLIFIETGLQTPTRLTAIRYFYLHQVEFHIAVKLMTAILMGLIYKKLIAESNPRIQ